MEIPFLSYFKKDKGNAAVKEKAAAPAKPVLPPIEKPSSERFSKTVMPNATRTLPPQDPFEMAARSTALGGQMPSVAATAPAPMAPRTISFAQPSPVVNVRDIPPAVALALEPTVERVIALELGDVVTEMPSATEVAVQESARSVREDAGARRPGAAPRGSAGRDAVPESGGRRLLGIWDHPGSAGNASRSSSFRSDRAANSGSFCRRRARRGGRRTNEDGAETIE